MVKTLNGIEPLSVNYDFVFKNLRTLHYLKINRPF
jgi:hypothetical protein